MIEGNFMLWEKQQFFKDTTKRCPSAVPQPLKFVVFFMKCGKKISFETIFV